MMKHFSITIILLSFFMLNTSAKKDESPQWITASNNTSLSSDIPQHFYYRKSFKLKKAPSKMVLRMMSQNPYNIWINGVPVVLNGQSFNENGELIMDTLHLKRYLIKGNNNISVKTRHKPEEGKTIKDQIYFQILRDDSLNIMSDDSWMCGHGDALKINMEPTCKITYAASEDAFLGFDNYLYNWKVRGKEKWRNVDVLVEQENIPSSSKSANRVTVQRVHHYKGIDLPLLLKESKEIEWVFSYEKPSLFGFEVESIGKKSIGVKLHTEELGLIELNYETKEGLQNFFLDIPLTITSASINLPVYLRLNSIYFKEL